MASPMSINEVRRAAALLNDRELLTKLADTDMRAQDTLYHQPYLRNLYNRERHVNESGRPVDKTSTLKAKELEEL